MKRKQDPKAVTSIKNSIHRSAVDRMGKELVKNFGSQNNEKLHFSTGGIYEGKRNKTIHAQESFTRASMTTYLL